MNRIAIGFAVVILAAATPSNPAAAAELPPQPPRAWYLLSQTDTTGALNGLPQRLAVENTAERRATAMWLGQLDRGRVRLVIDADAHVDGEILVGFFSDSRWATAELKQVRSFPGPGTYDIENLIPGKYSLGAAAGSPTDFAKVTNELPEGCGLGVHETWPNPVEIKPGVTTIVRINVSNKYKLNLQGHDIARGTFGLWDKVDPTNLITVRLRDTEGKPMPFCRVDITQLSPGNDFRLGSFHHLGTDALGRGYCDTVRGKYVIETVMQDFLPESFTHRIYGRQFPTIRNTAEPAIADVTVDPIPSGTAEVSGHVRDQTGRPLREFYLSFDRIERRGNLEFENLIIKVPFTNAEGKYSISNLPPGEYKPTIRSFDYPTIESRRSNRPPVIVPDTPNAAVLADFTVEAKELFYGQANFDDGIPVPNGGWTARFTSNPRSEFGGEVISFGLDEGGKFRVALSTEEYKKLLENFNGMLNVSAHDPSGATISQVQVHIDDLSKDPAQPTRVVIPRKPPAKSADK